MEKQAPKLQSVEPLDIAAAAPKTQVEKIEEATRQWFDDHVRNSPVAQEGRAWNHMVDALPELNRILLERLL